MKTLSEPSFSSGAVLAACADSVQSIDFSQRIRSAIPVVEAAEAGYRALAGMGMLFEVRSEPGVTGKLSAGEMQRLYTGTLAKKQSTVRHFYDAIRVAARNGICPLCNQRAVKTLDHYLSKDTHPQLAVTPLNLVPACSDCNKEKLNRLAKNAADQTLHPYFDDVGNARWLIASVVESNPPSVVFRAVPPAEISSVLGGRISTHFNTFGLADLYATHAAAELVNIRFIVTDLFDAAGAAGVRSFLARQAVGRSAADSNSWSAALYGALAGSDWFCTKGFLLAV